MGNATSKKSGPHIKPTPTPLQYACSRGKIYLVQQLINNGEIVDDICAFIAAYNCHFDIVKLLYEQGASLKIMYEALSVRIYDLAYYSEKKFDKCIEIRDFIIANGYYPYRGICDPKPYHDILLMFYPKKKDHYDDLCDNFPR